MYIKQASTAATYSIAALAGNWTILVMILFIIIIVVIIIIKTYVM